MRLHYGLQQGLNFVFSGPTWPRLHKLRSSESKVRYGLSIWRQMRKVSTLSDSSIIELTERVADAIV
jgi:hypothetical protein